MFAYHKLVLEDHEWGIIASTSNRTNGRFLIFNRVPKCASSMLVELLWQLQRNNHFEYYHSENYCEQQLTMQGEEEFLEWLPVTKNQNDLYQFPFAFDRHMYFINAELYNVEKGKKVNFTAFQNENIRR